LLAKFAFERAPTLGDDRAGRAGYFGEADDLRGGRGRDIAADKACWVSLAVAMAPMPRTYKR